MRIRRRVVLALLILGLLILAAVAVLFGGAFVHDFRYARLTRGIRDRDAVAEAEAAWARGDPRFMGIFGIGLSCPDVPNDPELLKKHGINGIQGTSDYLIGNRQAEFQKVASEFASNYNRAMLTCSQRAVIQK